MSSTSMSSTSMSSTVVVRMMSLPTVFHLHDGATIATISMVDHMLNPTIRESHSVLPLYISTFITRPLLTEVCVVLVIMHSVLKVEGIRLLMIISSTMAPMSNNSFRCRQAEHMDR